MGLSNIYCPGGISATLLCQSCVLGRLPVWGRQAELTFQGRGSEWEPPIAWVQLWVRWQSHILSMTSSYTLSLIMGSYFSGGGPPHVACGILVPWTENKLLPLQWKCGALTTGLPENFLIIGSYNLVCPPLLNGQQEVSLAWRWLVWPPTAWEARCSNNIGTCKRRHRLRQWFPESMMILFFKSRAPWSKSLIY